MSILGLGTTDTYSTERFTSVRRSVFYANPNGAAPLVGILSMLKEEAVSDPEFVHYEKRLSLMASTTTSGNAAGPFLNPVTNADLANTWTQAVATTVRVCVADRTFFRIGHQVKIGTVIGTTTDIFGNVYATGTNGGGGAIQYIDIVLTSVATAIGNLTTNNGIEVKVVGNTFAQGSTDISSQIYNLPTPIRNYTQIYRTPFALTGTLMKTPLKFDKNGAYADRAKEASLQHMIEMEWSMIYGIKLLTQNVSISNVGLVPQYQTGGIIYWLQQWELGSVYGNTAATVDTDDNKRIISNSTGVMTERLWDTLMERVFRYTSNTTNEKLVLCGSGFLNVMNQLFKSKSTLMSELPTGDTYGMDVTKVRTPFGTLYLKSHPLFNQNGAWRYNALILDVNNLKYKYVTDRDTTLLANRQLPDADYRKDEWLTEAGIQVLYPESHMLIKNVQNFGA